MAASIAVSTASGAAPDVGTAASSAVGAVSAIRGPSVNAQVALATFASVNLVAYQASCSDGDGGVFLATAGGAAVAAKVEIYLASAAPSMSPLLRERRVFEAMGAHPNVVSMHWYTEATVGGADGINLPWLTALEAKLPADHVLQRRLAEAKDGRVPLLLRVGLFDAGATTLQAASLERVSGWDSPALCGILSDIVAALHHCHSHGVVHRDIHGGNILRMADGRWVLADFASAAIADPATLVVPATRETVPSPHSPAYAAPEVHEGIRAVMEGRAAGIIYAKADVWALGALVYSLAHGSHPWPGYPMSSSWKELLWAVPPSPRTDLPTHLNQTLSWMLRAHPAHRPAPHALLARFAVWAGKAVSPAAAEALAQVNLASAPWIKPSPAAVASSTPAPPAPASGWIAVNVKSAYGGLVASVPTYIGDAKDPRSSHTFAWVLQAALDLLPWASIVQAGDTFEPVSGADLATMMAQSLRARCVLLHDNKVIDPGAPVGALARVYGAASLTLVCSAALAARQPDITVPGFGSLGPRPVGSSSSSGISNSLAVSSAVGAGAGAPSLSMEAAGPTAGAAMAMPPAVSGGTPVIAAVPVTSAGAGAGAASGGAAAPIPTKDGRPLTFAFADRDRGPNIMLGDSATTAATRDKWATVLLHGTIAPGAGSAAAASATRYTFAVRIVTLEPGAGCAIGFVDVSGAVTSPLRVEAFDVSRHNLGAHPGTWAYSKTGKISNYREKTWEEYGDALAVGDVVAAEVDPGEGRIRFYRNGMLQGTAFMEPELRTATLRGAVCLGSNTGGRQARVTLITPEVREFDRSKTHHRITFSEDGSTVTNTGKWASALAAHPGISHGRVSWSIRLDDTRHGAGVAIGVVDAARFDWEKQNLGASQGSWCYSKTGKKGDGTGFVEYGKQFTSGDVVTVTLDMDAKTLSFAVNGDDQGVAYDAASGIGAPPSPGTGSGALVPAVCLGSTEGNKVAKISLTVPPANTYRFDRFARSGKIAISQNGLVCETRDKWGTVFLDHPGVSSGKFSFAIDIVSAGQGCGAGIGFADPRAFKPQSRNLGAAEASWCFSKTGKKSAGVGFEPYSAPFKSGDRITAEVDFDADTIRFYVNGRPQGDAFTGGFTDKLLVPAVVLGSSDGGHLTTLRIAPPAVTRLDSRRCNKHIALSDNDRKATTDARWCSAVADHPGAITGTVRFAVQLEGDGGAALGFADANTFKPYMQNLGASGGTWALSKTGKKSAGDSEGFTPFTEKLSGGDIIGCEADMDAGVITFWKNGVRLGPAFTGLANRGHCMVPAICIGSNSGGKESTLRIAEFNPAWAVTVG